MKRVMPVICLIVVVLVACAVTGVAIGSQINSQLVVDNVRLHGLLNKAESRNAELIAIVNDVDRNSYFQGRYEQCIVDGYQEETCYSMINVIMQSKSR